MFFKHFFTQIYKTDFQQSQVEYVLETRFNYVAFQHKLALFIDFKPDDNVAELLVSKSYAVYSESFFLLHVELQHKMRLEKHCKNFTREWTSGNKALTTQSVSKITYLGASAAMVLRLIHFTGSTFSKINIYEIKTHNTVIANTIDVYTLTKAGR